MIGVDIPPLVIPAALNTPPIPVRRARPPSDGTPGRAGRATQRGRLSQIFCRRFTDTGIGVPAPCAYKPHAQPPAASGTLPVPDLPRPRAGGRGARAPGLGGLLPPAMAWASRAGLLRSLSEPHRGTLEIACEVRQLVPPRRRRGSPSPAATSWPWISGFHHLGKGLSARTGASAAAAARPAAGRSGRGELLQPDHPRLGLGAALRERVGIRRQEQAAAAQRRLDQARFSSASVPKPILKARVRASRADARPRAPGPEAEREQARPRRCTPDASSGACRGGVTRRCRRRRSAGKPITSRPATRTHRAISGGRRKSTQ